MANCVGLSSSKVKAYGHVHCGHLIVAAFTHSGFSCSTSAPPLPAVLRLAGCNLKIVPHL